jgi:hypothetical protein
MNFESFKNKNLSLEDISVIEDYFSENKEDSQLILSILKNANCDKEASLSLSNLIERIEFYLELEVPNKDKSPRESMFGTIVFYGDPSWENSSHF